jgi:phosphatidylserine/phosphatidylglycerophosphate/cardiolipin synthase-like enzyme
VSQPLRSLSPEELRALAKALTAGRLPTPLSPLALAPYLGRSSGIAASILIRLSEEGLAAKHLAAFLDILASERESHRAVAASLELVSTGPEAAGLPARDTRIVVRELFRQAEQSVLVAGYAVYQGRDVFNELAKRMEATPSLKVRMFLDVQRPYRDTSRSSEILRRFAERFQRSEWPGQRLPEVFYDPRSLDLEAVKRTSLHAKCVVVDNRVAFISSANFTEAAQVRNIEVGALIRVEAFARQLANHFLGLADRNILQRLPGI